MPEVSPKPPRPGVKRPPVWKTARSPFRKPASETWRRLYLAGIMAALAVLCFEAGYLVQIGRSGHPLALPKSLEKRNISTGGAVRPAVQILFAGGISCEGSGASVPLPKWNLLCESRRLELASGESLHATLPAEVAAASPGRIALEVPGWARTEVALPSADLAGHCVIAKPVMLSRLRAGVLVDVPAPGVDYDMLDLEWLRPLDDQPLARPIEKMRTVRIESAGRIPVAGLGTGIYKATLKSRTPDRVRDYVLAAELMVHDGVRSAQLSLPRSLSRTFVGYGGTSAYSPTQTGRFAFLFGVSVNVRKNIGEVLFDVEPLRRDQALKYADLKPRPDGFWPVTNLIMKDPSRLQFDCPLFYADHHMAIDAADGRVTLRPEFLMPSDDRELGDMLGRMRDLLARQVKKAAKDPSWYDSRYINVPAERLPYGEDLLTRERFGKHLARLTSNRQEPIDLGSRVSLRLDAEDSWDVQVMQPYGPQ